jgi:hypothetical protein
MKALLLIPLLALLPGPALAQVEPLLPPPRSTLEPLRPDPNRSSTGPIAPRRFSETLDDLEKQGIVTPSPAQAKPLSPREQQLLDRIRASKTPVEQWRRFGQCSYDWSGWKLHPNGSRTTGVDCGGTAMRWQIGVSCDRLLVNIRSREGVWSGWEPPAGPESKSRQGEDLMVASLCANALPAPVPAPAAAEVRS